MLNNNTHILKTNNGTHIIDSDFKRKNIIFHVEIATCVDENFYRDGDNSGFDYTFEVNMYLITKLDNNYTFHIYKSNEIETFSRKYNKFYSLDYEKIIYSGKNDNITLSELESNLPNNNDNIWWSLYNVAKMTEDQELLSRMKIIAKNIWNQKYKI
jgi:hypothetical protein